MRCTNHFSLALSTQSELARVRRQAEELRSRAAERRQELSAARHEARQLRRDLRAAEAARVALPAPQTAAPDVRVMHDPAASDRLRRLESDVRELADEREVARR
jgi:hypothetical protein